MNTQDFEKGRQRVLRPGRAVAVGYLGSLGVVAGALATGLLLQRAGAGSSNAGLVFLTAVLMSAVTYGLRPGLLACVASALAYNFFFFPPLYTLSIADPRNVVTVTIFGIVALIASNLAARVRAQSVAAQERAASIESLYHFSRKLAGAFTLDDLLWAIAFQFADMLRVRVVILLPEGRDLSVRAGYPPEDTLDDADLAAAKWVWDHATPAGRGADTLLGAKRLFLPMRTGRGNIGIVGLDSDRSGALLSPDKKRLFDSLSDQAALAIERLNLSEDIEKARLTAETERLRSALLTSISHDLKTPLASVLGSASTLKSHRSALDAESQDELIGTIYEEAERLNRFIANLLDMTKLESGAIEAKLEWIDLGDVVGSALRRAGPMLERHTVRLDLEPDLPMLKLDPVLFEQSLFNLLDNARKYSAAGTQIQLKARRTGNAVQLEISDEGDGIPESDLERIFDKFFRVQASDRKRAGTGLGLPICRGFVQAMGGSIVASNRPDSHGAAFTIALKIPADQPQERAA
jgi:two-component system sensor histidine kinase KdpD